MKKAMEPIQDIEYQGVIRALLAVVKNSQTDAEIMNASLMLERLGVKVQ